MNRIDTLDQLQSTSANILQAFLSTLGSHLIYQIQIVSTATGDNGVRLTGKFAVLTMYFLSDFKIKTKITSLILGSVDPTKLKATPPALRTIESTIHTNIGAQATPTVATPALPPTVTPPPKLTAAEKKAAERLAAGIARVKAAAEEAARPPFDPTLQPGYTNTGPYIGGFLSPPGASSVTTNASGLITSYTLVVDNPAPGTIRTQADADKYLAMPPAEAAFRLGVTLAIILAWQKKYAPGASP